MADARRAPLKDSTDIRGARVLIVEARFYDDLQDAMLEGAVAELSAAGVSHDVLTVTGSLEIPATIAIALDAAEKSGRPYDAAIALGCVIRGDTIHFEIVSMESSRALMDLSQGAYMSKKTPAACQDAYAAAVRLIPLVAPRDDEDTQIKSARDAVRVSAPECLARAGDCDAARVVFMETWADKKFDAPTMRTMFDNVVRRCADK